MIKNEQKNGDYFLRNLSSTSDQSLKHLLFLFYPNQYNFNLISIIKLGQFLNLDVRWSRRRDKSIIGSRVRKLGGSLFTYTMFESR